MLPDGAPPPVISATIASFTVFWADDVTAVAVATRSTPRAIRSWGRRIAVLRERGSSALELQDVEPRVGVGQVHEPVRIDIAVGRLDHLGSTRPWIDHARGILGHVIRDLARLERVPDVEDTNAGVVVGGEYQARALERAGSILVEIVRTEVAALGAVVGFRRLWTGSDADGIARLANVEDPHVAEALA